MSDSLTVFGVDYTSVTGIKAKGTENGTLTYIRPTGTKSISANGTGIDVTEYASVDVAVASASELLVTLTLTNGEWVPDKTFAQIQSAYSAGDRVVASAMQGDEPCETFCEFYDENGQWWCRVSWFDFNAGYRYIDDYLLTTNEYVLDNRETYGTPATLVQKTFAANGTYNPILTDSADGYSLVTVSVPIPTFATQSKTATPTTSQQVITPDSGYDGLSQVTVSAMPTGTAGTPTATKGTVSDHSVSVTPSVTNTTGYITGSTKTGTAVSVSASELVSGTYTVSASGTHDVTNYASASVAAGGATASATKGSVSNHSVVVTPSVTRTAGYVTAGSANGTAVTVSASELVSGSQTITDNGTVDVTNLASVTVAIDFVTYYVSSSEPTSSQGSDGDVWLVTA
jgi:hypothetical protein